MFDALFSGNNEAFTVDGFDRFVAEHHDAVEGLLPGDESLDTQRPVMATWMDALEDGDVVWCVGRAAGAYALLAAECVGSENVVAFHSDGSRLPTVRSMLASAGHGAVTVEPLTLLEWQTPDVRAEEAVTVGHTVDDPVQAMVDASGTPDRLTVLALDVPGYGADVLSSSDLLDRADVRAVLLKESDTLAESELEDAGFETTLVADRRSVRAPWRRATFATRRLDAPAAVARDRARPSSLRRDDVNDLEQSGDESSTTPGRSDDGGTGNERRPAVTDAWQARDVLALIPALVLYALSGVFYGIAILLEGLGKIPGFGYVFANAMIGVIVAILFGAFFVLVALLTAVTGPLGVPDQATAGVAGGVIVALPLLGALGFAWLAIATRNDGR
jgi:hypothetical protein